LTAVGDDAQRRQHSGNDQTAVTPEASDASEESEALEWASSLGLWTDQAIRSKPEVLESAVFGLSEVLKEDQEARHRSRVVFHVRLVLALLTTLSAIGVFVSFVVSSPAHARPFLAALLGVLIGSAAFLVGFAFSRSSLNRRKRKEEELVRKVLAHERNYRRRLFEQESQK